MSLHRAEELFISSFIVRHRQERHRLLLGDPRRRKRIVGRLNHVVVWDLAPGTERQSLPYEAEAVHYLLRKVGAEQVAHIISDDADYDGQDVPVAEAIRIVLTEDSGTVACCGEGVAIYRPEAPAPAMLLLSRRKSVRE